MKLSAAEVFQMWLDANCDEKRHHIGSRSLSELGGSHYECDYWHFVIEDHDDGETPSIVVEVGCEERSNYMAVEVANYDESGGREAACFLGLFTSTDDLNVLLKLLVRINRT